jgi:hypothetical protein
VKVEPPPAKVEPPPVKVEPPPAKVEARPATPLPSSTDLPKAPEPPRARQDPPKPVDETEEDEAAIRRVIATYARAIENKDLALFRSIKPNLSGEERRRIEDGFRAVSSQRVTVTIQSITRQGREATVRLRRRDEIDAGGRRQTSESQQTLMLDKTGNTWIIREIGR